MKTPSGHQDFLLVPSFSFYTPTFLPRLEHRLFPPRDTQTLEHTASSSFISILRLLYVFSIVLPIHVTASLISHTIYPKRTWQDNGWGRGRFPTRLAGWGLGQTIGVPLVGSLFWALVYGSPKGMGWEEERTLPRASKWLFGRGHEGWCIEAEGVTLPPLPTAPASTFSSKSNKKNGSLRKRSRNGSAGDTDWMDEAAAATSLPSEACKTTAAEPLPYNAGNESVSLDILRGQVTGIDFGVKPEAVPAFWQWKSIASAVSHGKVISVKPGNDVAGIGAGPALSADERMVLFFVGGGYHSGHAPQGPLSWTVCRQTSLRVLGVNFRKATSDNRAFPAALQDALAAWVYVTKRLKFKPENVVLMGDSAGGGLAMTLQLYLSSLIWSGNETGLGRAKRVVLHSPMTDLTLATKSFWNNAGVDIITPYMCSLARDNYLRHVIPVPGRKNPHVDAQRNGQKMVAQVSARYNIDPYNLTDQIESGEQLQQELRRLAKELPETIVELGAFHPLFSMGLDAKQNKYLAQALLLLKPNKEVPDSTLEILITAGTGELFYDQIKLFVRNLLDLNHDHSDEKALGDDEEEGERGVKVSLVECVDWHHVFAFMNFPSEVKAEVDDVAKTFMLA